MQAGIHLVADASVMAIVLAGVYRVTRLEQKVSWLCTRYAEDHESAVDWSGSPIADGGEKRDVDD